MTTVITFAGVILFFTVIFLVARRKPQSWGEDPSFQKRSNWESKFEELRQRSITPRAGTTYIEIIKKSKEDK